MRLGFFLDLPRQLPNCFGLPREFSCGPHCIRNRLLSYPFKAPHRMALRAVCVNSLIHLAHIRQGLNHLVCQAHVLCHLNLQKTRITQRSMPLRWTFGN
jgi:hypothetical protein